MAIPCSLLGVWPALLGRSYLLLSPSFKFSAKVILSPPPSVHSTPPQGFREASWALQGSLRFSPFIPKATPFLFSPHSPLCSQSDFPQATPSLIAFQPVFPYSHTSRNLQFLCEAFPKCLGEEGVSLLESHPQSGSSASHYSLPNKNANNSNNNSNR